MAFPTTAVPVVVKIAPGADPAASPGTWSWQDITTSVRLQDRIEMVTGRQNEASTVDPARCTMRLDNTSGDFTPRNPSGQWYGLLGRNTPLRVQILRGQDAFGRTVSNGWGTSDSGQAWTVGTGAASDFSVSGGSGLHSHGTINFLRRTVLGVSLADVEQVVDVTTPVLLTGAALVTGLVARHTSGGPNYYWLRCEFNAGGTSVQLKISKCVGGTITDLANLNPVPGLAYAANTPMRIRAQVLGNQLAMKVWPAAGVEPAGWHLEVADDSITGAGQTGVQSWVVGGNTNTLPLVVSHDNYTAHVDRFSGFVSSWPPRWDPTGRDQTVPIQADGILRRLGQGSPPARSALRRTIAATSPAAYWPGEDGTTAKQLASAISGHPPMTVTGTAEFVQISNTGINSTQRSGSAALVNLAGGGQLTAPVPSDVTTATTSRWTFHVRADVDPAVTAGSFVLADWLCAGGTYVRWRIIVTATDTQLVGINSAGTSTTLDSTVLFVGLATYSVVAQQVGGNISITFCTNSPISTAGTLAGISSVSSNTSRQTATDQVTVGHFAIWTGTSVPYVSADTTTDGYGKSMMGAGLSYRYEPAHARLARLCAEDGVRLAVPAVPEYAAARMGWQAPGTPVDLYRQCEATDVGVLYEAGFGLAYLPRDARYNRAVTLALDYAAGQIAPPFEPVDDDQLLRNRVTVQRIDGSEVTAEDAASVAAAGEVATSYDISVAAGFTTASDDDVLPDHASWRLRLGTADVMRWPVIGVNLARSPELIDAVLSCRVQSRATVVNPPATVAGDDIDVLVEGYSETIGYKDWTVGFTTSPAGVWDVATVDGTQRVAADGSTLQAGITSGATSLTLLSTTANGPWTTDPTDMPLDVRVGGEQVTLSSIAPLIDDPLDAAVSNGWGTTPTGEAWQVALGTAANFSQSGGFARHALPANDTPQVSLLPLALSTFDVLFPCRITALSTGAQLVAELAGRWVDASNHYRWEVGFQPAGTLDVRIVRVVAGTRTVIPGGSASAVSPYAANASVWVRCQAEGTMLRAKVWQASDPEPNAWQVWVTDGTYTSGQIGIYSLAAGGNTNTKPVEILYGSFTITNPQRAAVSARGVNGVNRAWPAGTEVDVWYPAIAAL